MKCLYCIHKARNHWFATYHTYHKDKLGMRESTYDSCFLYISDPFGIVRMQTDITLILANNEFISIEEDTIKSAKIITKDREHLTSAHRLKFNSVQIKLDSNKMVVTKKSRVGEIFLVTDHIPDFTSSRGITRKQLLSKKQYLAWKARSAYITSICQSEAFFNLF